jgi:hypothetical protein
MAEVHLWAAVTIRNVKYHDRFVKLNAFVEWCCPFYEKLNFDQFLELYKFGTKNLAVFVRDT